MSPTLFYRAQAELQQKAADGAALQNVRELSQRAANAWTALANRSERSQPRNSPTASPQHAIEAGT